MLLRRVIQHVRNQDWAAIAIDFLIVVIGVFVGIQVSNWNDEVKTQRKAEVFSERLKSDIRYEAWGYEYFIEYNDDLLKNAERTVAALSENSSVSDEEFLVTAYRASNFGYLDRRRATFDELIATGEIALIDDARLLETAVSNYNTPIFELIMEDGKNSEYREIFRKTVPVEIQRALLEDCGDRDTPPLDYDAIVDSLDYECSLKIPADDISVAAAMLRENEYLLPALRLRFADIETALSLLKNGQKDTRENLQEIGGVAKARH